MNVKTATQAGWSLRYSVSSSGFQFITARDLHGNYCQYHVEDGGEIVPANINDIGLDDMPMSVYRLIHFWFGKEM